MVGVQTCSRILETDISTEEVWPNLIFSQTACEFSYVETEKGGMPSRHALTYPVCFKGFPNSKF